MGFSVQGFVRTVPAESVASILVFLVTVTIVVTGFVLKAVPGKDLLYSSNSTIFFPSFAKKLPSLVPLSSKLLYFITSISSNLTVTMSSAIDEIS